VLIAFRPGQAAVGAMFFGVATSLSGIVTTAVAAAADNPELASSNAVGGIAAQTTAIAVADMVYTRSNLEHGRGRRRHLSWWLAVPRSHH
jgi:cation:H+ antiporter